MSNILKNSLIRWYHRTLDGQAAEHASCSRKLLRATLQKLGCSQTVESLEHHTAQAPYNQGRGFMGHVDLVYRLEPKGLYEVKGWLSQVKKRIVALTFFDTYGIPAVADYGFVRVDLVSILPHIKHAGLSGFRVVLNIQDEEKELRLTFRAILSNEAIEFGYLPPFRPLELLHGVR